MAHSPSDLLRSVLRCEGGKLEEFLPPSKRDCQIVGFIARRSKILGNFQHPSPLTSPKSYGEVLLEKDVNHIRAWWQAGLWYDLRSVTNRQYPNPTSLYLG